MKLALEIVQALLGILLSGAILIQSQGTGLGRAWGGGGEFYRGKRGVEKLVFRATIFLAVFFLATSITALMIG